MINLLKCKLNLSLMMTVTIRKIIFLKMDTKKAICFLLILINNFDDDLNIFIGSTYLHCIQLLIV